MKPLNQKERNKAFVQFLIGFLITFAIFVAAIFYDFRMPMKENEMLRKQNESMRSAIEKQDKMMAIMSTIDSTMATLDQPDPNATFKEQLVSTKIIEMDEANKDASTSSLLYQKIAGTYKAMLADKKRLRDSGKDKAAADENCRKLNDANNQIIQLRTMLTNAGVTLPAAAPLESCKQ
jgi:Tfp pilus assembly protein PilO